MTLARAQSETSSGCPSASASSLPRNRLERTRQFIDDAVRGVGQLTARVHVFGHDVFEDDAAKTLLLRWDYRWPAAFLPMEAKEVFAVFLQDFPTHLHLPDGIRQRAILDGVGCKLV